MINYTLKLFLLLLLIIPAELFAQDNRFSGWGALFHTQRFSPKWGASFDAQFRTANQYSYLQNVLVRPSMNYYFDNNKMAALGYAYIATNGVTEAGEDTFRPESRIWEQLIINTKLTNTATLQHRFRLEQRFLGNTTARNDHYFSQRLRYFARAVIPLKSSQTFTEGPFLGLQNEIMFNVQNNHKVNKHFFDQNRAYVALGYRLEKKIDIEFGYLNQFVQQTSATYFNHVLQAVVYTRF